MINNYNEKNKEERKAGIIRAFYSAYFSRVKMLSGADLQKVLEAIDEPEKEVMSDEEMLAVAKKLCTAFGGE
ncbi:hypothetical protein [Desulfosporosinus fructosivorans]